MKYRSFRMLCILISAMIIAFNVFGFDDKDLLLYFTTPIVWINEVQLMFRQFGSYMYIFVYACNLLIWYLVGFLLDLLLGKIAARLKKKK